MYGESLPFKETACTAVADSVHKRLKVELPEILASEKINSSLRTVGKDAVHLQYEPVSLGEVVPLFDAAWETLKEHVQAVFTESRAQLLTQYPTAELLDITFSDSDRTIIITQKPLS